jgi:hypothetical protein
MVDLMLEASPSIMISSDDDTNSTMASDGEYDSDHYSDVDMPMGDDVDTQYSVDLNCDGNMQCDSNNDVEKDEQMEDGEEVVAEVVDEDGKVDKDKDDCKEHWKIAQGDMIHTSADHGDTLVGNQSIVQSEQGQEMCEHTLPRQPAESAPPLQTP